MTKRWAMLALLMLLPSTGSAQTGGIRVEPASVNVSSQGPSTLIVTFVGVDGYTPLEAVFCTQIVTMKEFGARCEPSSIIGQGVSAAGTKPLGSTFTDIVTVPAPVAERAYEAALAGQPGRFFYVRHFASNSAVAGDQYVAVVCVLGTGGANAPFALTNVRLRTASDAPVLFVNAGDAAPRVSVDISYTGTGRLQGRWEIVTPGEETPSPFDLLPEGALTGEQRGLQRRYREIERFNTLLLPTGRFTLDGPDPALLPTAVTGSYMLLLRVETAAATFAMPTIRYVVEPRAGNSRVAVQLQSPAAGALVSADSALTLAWSDVPEAARYRVQIESISDGKMLLSAIVARGSPMYEVPPFITAQLSNAGARWRVVAIDSTASEIGHSEWRRMLRRP